MRRIIAMAVLLVAFCAAGAWAEAPLFLTDIPAPPASSVVSTPALGWGPQVIATATAFYFDGRYKVLQGSPMVGAAYTWNQQGNVNSTGLFIGPSIVNQGSSTETTVNVLAHINLFQTKVGGFGLGLGTEFWKSGTGVKPMSSTSYFTIDYSFAGPAGP